MNDANKPEWKDAPTEPGIWLFAPHGYAYALHAKQIMDMSIADFEGYRWFGPVPIDPQAKIEPSVNLDDIYE